MESEVIEVELGEIGEFTNGANFSQSDYGPGYPIVNVKQLYGGRFIDLHDLESLSKEVLKRPERLFLREGDILFARSSVKRSGAGQCAMVPRGVHQTIFSGFIIRLRLNDLSETNPMFLNYLLQSPKYREVFSRIATGTTISNLSQDSLKGISVRLPSKVIQDEVAAMLGEVDDRITLLHQCNSSLEALARAIFKSWFVDFDPVRAKAEGREPEGMAAATAALFPTGFHSLPSGLIPHMWGTTTLGNVTEVITRGVSPKYAETGVLVLNQKCIREGRVNTGLGRRHDLDNRIAPQKFVRHGDILVNSTGVGTLGRVAQVFQVDEDTTVDSHVSIVRPNKARVEPEFLGTLLVDRQEEIEGLATGTTGQTELSRDALRAMPVMLPEPVVMERFADIVRPLNAAVFSNSKRSATLATIRDTLLPRLISGKLRVPEAERMLEAVL
jgi:type I restriction enzyme S subunit